MKIRFNIFCLGLALIGLALPLVTEALAIEPVAGASITLGTNTQEIPYTVNPTLRLEPKNPIFYAKLNAELEALEIAYANKAAFEGGVISFTAHPEAQNTAPTVYKILKQKLSTLAQRLKVDLSTINLCIRPTSDSIKSAFNAHAQLVATVTVKTLSTIRESDGAILDTKTSKEVSVSHKISINAESLKLFAWYEGDDYWPEGALDGALAHELGHAYHQHIDNSVACEYEADDTGSLCLNNPRNVMKAVDMLTLAGNLFSSLDQSMILRLDRQTMFRTIHIITSNIINALPELSELGKSQSHTQFAYRIGRAVNKAQQRITAKHLANDTKLSTSLLYDELEYECNTPAEANTNQETLAVLHNYEQNLALRGMLTHPAPEARRNHNTQFCASLHSSLC